MGAMGERCRLALDAGFSAQSFTCVGRHTQRQKKMGAARSQGLEMTMDGRAAQAFLQVTK